DRVAAELSARRWPCKPHALRRAEAAARPGYSHRVFVGGARPDRSLFHSYLCAIFEQADSLAALSPAECDALVTELAPVLRPDGRASALWRMVMPGVPEALERIRQHGLTLAVISNSDGTCAASLEAAGLLRYMNVVIDSAEVGVEKPDPRIFEIAVARCGADPRRALYVGDLYHADVVGARGAGLHALLLDPYGDWPPLDCERATDLSAVADRLAR
ncbi:MAG TPA: HAD-IA family hydrolase, partial [Vicinamibacterales bacterium]|nr:HAD-IA family hydrolase [Vicinamibacterales bacterium]